MSEPKSDRALLEEVVEFLLNSAFNNQSDDEFDRKFMDRIREIRQQLATECKYHATISYCNKADCSLELPCNPKDECWQPKERSP